MNTEMENVEESKQPEAAPADNAEVKPTTTDPLSEAAQEAFDAALISHHTDRDGAKNVSRNSKTPPDEIERALGEGEPQKDQQNTT